MKSISLVTALALAQLGLAGAPYNDEYGKYCTDGKAQGSIAVSSSQLSYFCDSQAPVGKHSVKVSSATSCGDICNEDSEGCDTAVWDHSTGLCWLGQASGSRTPASGYMVISAHPANHADDDSHKDDNSHKDDKDDESHTDDQTHPANDSHDSQASSCQSDLEGLQKYKPVNATCDENDRQVSEVNNQRFYMACSRSAPNLTMEPDTYDSLADCMERCTNVKGCRFVTYQPGNKFCFSGDSDWFLSKPSADRNFHSAFKVGG